MGQEDTAVSVRDDQPSAVPVLPLRDVVVYPHMVIPLFVGREKSIKALDAAMADNKQILLVAAKRVRMSTNRSRRICTRSGPWRASCSCSSCPDGTVKVLVEGPSAPRSSEVMSDNEFFTAEIESAGDLIELPSARWKC